MVILRSVGGRNGESRSRLFRIFGIVLVLLGVSGELAVAAGVDSPAAPPAGGGATVVDDARLAAADSDHGNWLSYGRTYSEQRFSPLDEIDTANVGRLRQIWSFSTGQTRGHEATPIAIDGVLYFTASWSIVYAIDARNGAELWRYDPKVPGEAATKACCDVVNRGVAAWRGRIYSATLDGRLIALDAKTGQLVWETMTVDPGKAYTITGAPRVVKGRVVIGNGGAELGVRGYISAYEADTGALAWRTFTVPGNPADGFESPAMEKAAATWKGGNWWEVGGGGTAWDSMAYDPDLDLLYVGTGNGSPWVRKIRSPGGGDNLYLSCILALKPDTGTIVWHYQTTPGETWDYTATQSIVLADLAIGGRTRKVLMQAPKNGFFYVLDRETGELLSARNYVEVTWAKSVDLATGRPVEAAGQDFSSSAAFVKPGPLGGHNWQPMSFSPRTGLVYIPAQEVQGLYRRDKDFLFKPGKWNTGTDFNTYSLLLSEYVSGHLLAWDPIAQREVWRHPYGMPWNGGTLATAGDLVFQGTADGRFLALDARSGKELWESHVGTGIGAGPITYNVEGRQYVTVVAGWGGSFALIGGDVARQLNNQMQGRVVTYALTEPELPPSDIVESYLDGGDAIAEGERLYHRNCAVCHGSRGVSGSAAIPDLRHTTLDYQAFDNVIRQGLLVPKGMPNLGRWLDAKETRLIKAYLEDAATSTSP